MKKKKNEVTELLINMLNQIGQNPDRFSIGKVELPERSFFLIAGQLETIFEKEKRFMPMMLEVEIHALLSLEVAAEEAGISDRQLLRWRKDGLTTIEIDGKPHVPSGHLKTWAKKFSQK